MSIILNALQKQTENQVGYIANSQKNRSWEIALLICFLIIIVLLSALIFILLRPPVSSLQTQPETPVQVEAPTQRLAPIEHVQIKKTLPKVIEKVSFLTQPLPTSTNKIALPELQLSQSETPLKSSLQQANQLEGNESPNESLPVLEDVPEPLQDDNSIDYSNVSDELQQRFKRALSINSNTAKALIESDNSDGSDLHQMADDFQQKVPPLSYDFHVYSSIAKDRWIRINGEDLIEGQFDSSGDIQVIEIQPNRTIFRFGSQSFSLQSLIDWQGRDL